MEKIEIETVIAVTDLSTNEILFVTNIVEKNEVSYNTINFQLENILRKFFGNDITSVWILGNNITLTKDNKVRSLQFKLTTFLRNGTV